MTKKQEGKQLHTTLSPEHYEQLFDLALRMSTDKKRIVPVAEVARRIITGYLDGLRAELAADFKPVVEFKPLPELIAELQAPRGTVFLTTENQLEVLDPGIEEIDHPANPPFPEAEEVKGE